LVVLQVREYSYSIIKALFEFLRFGYLFLYKKGRGLRDNEGMILFYNSLSRMSIYNYRFNNG
jgi:hypothetical protein